MLLEQLGAGGMASVFRATDTRLGVDRAIKLLHADFLRSPSVIARFEREARVMAELEHPNVVPVHDVGREGDAVFLVMSLLPDGSLEDRLRTHGPMPARDATVAMVGILQALEAAHERGIIHRDIKPHNILVDARGTARLTDFGIAHDDRDSKLTKTGALMGTWAYMAPEQRSGEKIDARADLYAAGATFLALLRDVEPHDLHNPESHATQLDGLPAGLAKFVERCTRYHPADRFQTATEARIALEALLGKVPDTPLVERVEVESSTTDELPREPSAETGNTLLAFLDDATPAGETAVPLHTTTTAPAPTELSGSEFRGSADGAAEFTRPAERPRLSAPPAPAERRRALPLLGALAVGVLAVGVGVAGFALSFLGTRPEAPEPYATEVVPLPVPTADPILTERPVPTEDPVRTEPMPVPVDPTPTVVPDPAPNPRPAPRPVLAPDPVPAPEPPPTPTVQPVEPAPAPEPVPTPLPGVRVEINSRPCCASVRLDGAEVGQTPYSASVPPGSHTVELLHDSGARIYRKIPADGSVVQFCWDFSSSQPCAR
ncbi:MAG: serine/threonine-protein kinase [Myxococcota bacterium]